MEFIFELLFEIIVEGAVELTSHKKVPMPLRILAFLICFFIFGGVTAIMFAGAYGSWKDQNTGAFILFAAVGIMMLVCVIYMIRKQFKAHKQESEDKTAVDMAKPSSRRQIIEACIAAVILILLGAFILYNFELFE